MPVKSSVSFRASRGRRLWLQQEISGKTALWLLWLMISVNAFLMSLWLASCFIDYSRMFSLWISPHPSPRVKKVKKQVLFSGSLYLLTSCYSTNVQCLSDSPLSLYLHCQRGKEFFACLNLSVFLNAHTESVFCLTSSRISSFSSTVAQTFVVLGSVDVT